MYLSLVHLIIRVKPQTTDFPWPNSNYSAAVDSLAAANFGTDAKNLRERVGRIEGEMITRSRA